MNALQSTDIINSLTYETKHVLKSHQYDEAVSLQLASSKTLLNMVGWQDLSELQTGSSLRKYKKKAL